MQIRVGRSEGNARFFRGLQRGERREQQYGEEREDGVHVADWFGCFVFGVIRTASDVRVAVPEE